jgi:hypothetical protein
MSSKSLIKLIVIILVLAMLPGIIPAIGKSLSDLSSKLLWAVISSAGKLPGKVLSGLKTTQEMAVTKYQECLVTGIRERNLQAVAARLCPKGTDSLAWEGCLENVLSAHADDGSVIVQSCRERELTVGFLANMWKGIACEWVPWGCKP